MDDVNLPSSTLMYVLRSLASLKLTLVILVALVIGVTAAYLYGALATWLLAGPLVLFALNLTSALITNPAFWRQKPLLLFHVCLITIVLLIAAGRLSHLTGTLELTSGIPFNGELTSAQAGPFHSGRLTDVRFVSESFEIDYDIGLTRGDTRNKVSWMDSKGEAQAMVVRDYYPLVLSGYRFYTTPNKGFAPEFSWLPDSGPPFTGSIHLPSYPLNEFKQALEWTPPGTMLKLWTQLQFNEVILDPAKPSQFRIPEKHKIVLRYGNNRHELMPGESIKLPGGTLRYNKLGTWMGYTVFYDWTISWLLGVSMLAVLFLGWHFWQKYFAKPWLPD